MPASLPAVPDGALFTSRRENDDPEVAALEALHGTEMHATAAPERRGRGLAWTAFAPYCPDRRTPTAWGVAMR
jgi:hypothetical protein